LARNHPDPGRPVKPGAASQGACAAPANRQSYVGKPTKGKRTMYLSGQSILVILLVGLIAGWLAGQIVRGTGFGLIGDIAIGIVGAFIASWLFPKLGIHIATTGLVREIIVATLGAIILLLIIRLVRGGGRW
jgi:uncharacterized membrane protein YeaQ/YmgE (transglycosylase-associated protein family)